MIFAQLSVTLTAVKKVSAKEEQMAACTLHCINFSFFFLCFLKEIIYSGF